MAAKTPARRRLASQVANVARHHPDDPSLPALRAELAVEGLAEHIERVANSVPPLSPAQRERLALLLHPGTSRLFGMRVQVTDGDDYPRIVPCYPLR